MYSLLVIKEILEYIEEIIAIIGVLIKEP